VKDPLAKRPLVALAGALVFVGICAAAAAMLGPA